MRFFYGSVKSGFWKYLSSALQAHDPTDTPALPNGEPDFSLRRREAINLLEDNNILMTDSLYRTNRFENRDEDKNLWRPSDTFAYQNSQTNLKIMEYLEEFPTIDGLFFTATVTASKSPFFWFRQAMRGHIEQPPNWNFIAGRRWHSILKIDSRYYQTFLLPTPKPRGIHFTDNQRLESFVNYLQSIDNDFYKEIAHIPKATRTPIQNTMLSAHREAFLVECFRQAIVLRNQDFNGTVLPNGA
ncbi:MAG: hypothetical protein WDO15_19630 [Bacteroidota bacterium]